MLKNNDNNNSINHNPIYGSDFIIKFQLLRDGRKSYLIRLYYDSVDGTPRDSGTRTNMSARTNYIKQHMKQSVSTIIVILASIF